MNLRISLSAGIIALAMTASLGNPAQAQDYQNHRHQVCHNVRIQDKPKDNHRIAGTAIGAVAGGLLGHQVGSGKGNTLATVGGAVAGGYVGNRVQANHQENNASYHVERRCHWVDG